MNILLTNDDGYDALGMKILVEVAKKYGNVTVVAPLLQQSGKSQAIKIRKEMELKEQPDIIPGVKTYSLDGTPADCVRVALSYLKLDVDIVFSGINDGYNVGEDIQYSGTCGAAMEAASLGKKAMAVSTSYRYLEYIKKDMEDVLDKCMEKKIYEDWILWNINVPLDHKGIRLTIQGKTNYELKYELSENSKVISVGRPLGAENNLINSDTGCVNSGYASITPLTVDRTNLEILSKVNNKYNFN